MLRWTVPRVWSRLSRSLDPYHSLHSIRPRLLSGLAVHSFSARQAFEAPRFSSGKTKGSSFGQRSPFSTDAAASRKLQTQSSGPTPPPKRRAADDFKEYQERAATGSTAMFDTSLIDPDNANVFPRIKTTSLSTKRIVIHDEALSNSVTLVLVAFRSFADDQLQSWRRAFEADIPQDCSQWYDVTINESFGSQALSGFIQRLQRGRTEPALHDYYVAFNSRAREPLEQLLPSRNRMFGYVLLLDQHARVRFRASGMASDEAVQVFLSCARKLVQEDRGT